MTVFKFSRLLISRIPSRRLALSLVDRYNSAARDVTVGMGNCYTSIDCTTLGRERFDLGPKPRVDFQNHERSPKEGILDME